MKDGVFTVRIDPEKGQQLDALASAMDRSRNYLVNQAIDQFLEVQNWQIEQIKEGIKAANRGEFATVKKVNRVFNKYEPKSR